MKEKNQPQTPFVPKTLTRSEKRRKIFLLLCALIGINLFVFGSLYFSVSKVNEGKKIINRQSSIINPSPTPFPFQEMTIPYLRSRTYSSKLSPLEKISENDSYTSYLTSYDSDGIKVNGLLTVPKISDGQRRLGGFPAIVFVHGYIPPSTYQTTSNYADYVDYLAGNGFVVFKIDLQLDTH